jgi:AmmeMemoRadiSam system protein A
MAPAASHPLVELARRAIEGWVRDGREIALPAAGEGSDRRAGVFVSLKKGGELRGCIGTFLPTAPSVAAEVVRNAIAAATGDPRFPPVGRDELPLLEVSVDELTSPEPVAGPEELDPARYGVIVESRGRRGLLLPDLPGVETPAQQVAIAARKAGIGPGEMLRLCRFRVSRYS